MIIIANSKKNLSRRYYANVIDYLILFILFGIYVFMAGDQDDSGAYRVTGLKTMVIPLLWILYFPVCEGTTGWTIGKKAFRLSVIDLNGQAPSMIQAFLRRMLDILELFLFGIPALLVINSSDKNQRIGDMIAGTTVVRTHAICRHCKATLELSAREVLQDSFLCPACNEMN